MIHKTPDSSLNPGAKCDSLQHMVCLYALPDWHSMAFLLGLDISAKHSCLVSKNVSEHHSSTWLSHGKDLYVFHKCCCSRKEPNWVKDMHRAKSRRKLCSILVRELYSTCPSPLPYLSLLTASTCMLMIQRTCFFPQ